MSVRASCPSTPPLRPRRPPRAVRSGRDDCASRAVANAAEANGRLKKTALISGLRSNRRGTGVCLAATPFHVVSPTTKTTHPATANRRGIQGFSIDRSIAMIARSTARLPVLSFRPVSLRALLLGTAVHAKMSEHKKSRRKFAPPDGPCSTVGSITRRSRSCDPFLPKESPPVNHSLSEAIPLVGSVSLCASPAPPTTPASPKKPAPRPKPSSPSPPRPIAPRRPELGWKGVARA
jgi:hypothetical protein